MFWFTRRILSSPLLRNEGAAFNSRGKILEEKAAAALYAGVCVLFCLQGPAGEMKSLSKERQSSHHTTAEVKFYCLGHKFIQFLEFNVPLYCLDFKLASKPTQLFKREFYKTTSHSQFVSFERGMVQQVKASVVLLGEVDVGDQDQDLDDASEILCDGVVKWCVSVGVLQNINQNVEKILVAKTQF